MSAFSSRQCASWYCEHNGVLVLQLILRAKHSTCIWCTCVIPLAGEQCYESVSANTLTMVHVTTRPSDEMEKKFRLPSMLFFCQQTLSERYCHAYNYRTINNNYYVCTQYLPDRISVFACLGSGAELRSCALIL